MIPRGATVHFVDATDRARPVTVTGRVEVEYRGSVLVLARDGRTWNVPPDCLRLGRPVEPVEERRSTFAALLARATGGAA